MCPSSKISRVCSCVTLAVRRHTSASHYASGCFTELLMKSVWSKAKQHCHREKPSVPDVSASVIISLDWSSPCSSSVVFRAPWSILSLPALVPYTFLYVTEADLVLESWRDGWAKFHSCYWGIQVPGKVSRTHWTYWSGLTFLSYPAVKSLRGFKGWMDGCYKCIVPMTKLGNFFF